ncbi:uncharacterized protein KGF55_000115 [Candida pseudojiufengensis]|uniref:uncharacterized protein n=1 Tax=Candida pseudojiufengensis TaxID=497109 RepID=UPI002224A853|nr:uncharacterized protein KGF55_000115 [Candida pseudojiufengensis]KAI5966706.1 hypothetical protein KGF55_000115 [Candida pseudojiufengensis]
MFKRSIQLTLKKRSINFQKSIRKISTDINNGQADQKTWPNLSSVLTTFRKESYSLIGWGVALSGILFWGPYLTVKGSDAVDHVPHDTGAQVKLEKVGLNDYKAVVDIPQTYVQPDKEDDDEAEDVDVEDED